MEILPLIDEDFDLVYAAFLEAFSDYLVKMNPSREQFAETLTRRGYVPQVSAGAFEGQRLVAFTLNGVEERRGYDTGTGVVPSHRKMGLATAVMERSYSLLRSRLCTRYVLEVIEANNPAIALYRACGFLETRRLQCWSFESDGHASGDFLNTGLAGPRDWDTRQRWWTISPSWQNSTASIRRARDRFLALGDEDGYAILFPSNGDLAQLAVRPERRRQRVGTRLLHQAAALAGKPLRIMNVDDGDEGIARFLEHAGAIRTVRQIEMEREL